MPASESPFQSYKLKRNFVFRYFNLFLSFRTQSAKISCQRFAILSYSEKLWNVFEIVLENCEVFVQKSLSVSAPSEKIDPKSFRTRKALAKSQTLLMTTELFYSHVLNINGSSFHTRSFRREHLSVFRHREVKNGFTGPKSFRGFQEKGLRTANDPAPQVIPKLNRK